MSKMGWGGLKQGGGEAGVNHSSGATVRYTPPSSSSEQPAQFFRLLVVVSKCAEIGVPLRQQSRRRKNWARCSEEEEGGCT